MNSGFKSYAQENGGRVIVLFLLFLLALYNFYKAGLQGYLMVFGALPIIVIGCYLVFRFKMFAFWTLFFVNYFIMFITRHISIGIPASFPNELLELMLIALAIIEINELKFEKLANLMFLSVLLWFGFCLLEVMNNTCGLGYRFDLWYTGARLMSFQLVYAVMVCCIYVSTPKRVITFLTFWGFCIIFATYWVWKQRNIGFTDAERAWLFSPAGRSHNISSGIRYFSMFTDAATFGIHMAAASIAFFIFSITTKIKKHKIYFIIIGILSLWSMFTSGTRTGIFCFILGGMLYIVVSKNIKIATSVSIVGLLLVSLLAFTKIGQGNQMIRRMRTAFDRNDASASVRDINKEAISKYMKDAPWGIGIGLFVNDIPAWNKFRIVSSIPPDSEYVFIWVRTGVIGVTIFALLNALMLGGACYTSMFRIRSTSLRGIGAGFCCAFIAVQLGGYANQVLMQFPNVLIFYGGLSIVYVLPLMETSWNEWEAKEIAKQEEKKRLKLEKKRASRV